MKELIINKPYLQSRLQKLGSFCITLISWLLWSYFLLPLITLTGWLMGVKSLSVEVRWFGGYKTLLELLEMYGGIIAGIAVFWIGWTLLRTCWKPLAVSSLPSLLETQKMSESFHISTVQLQQGRLAKLVTVSFDDHGKIIDIKNDKKE